MNILFDINHPAHLHLFKNFILYLKKSGHKPIVLTRDKDVTNVLAKYYRIEYSSVSKHPGSFWGLFLELVKRDVEVFKLYRKYRFPMAFGTSVSIAHLSIFTKCKSYNFNEDDDGVSKYYEFLTYPFTTKIVSPDLSAFASFPAKRLHHKSYHEFAYLHPSNFKPDLKVLKKYSLKSKEYIIVRKNTLKASHDLGAKGLDGIWDRMMARLKDYNLVISKEGSKTHQIDPWDMHSVMYYAKMIISDSQTMSEEAAVLGVPSLRMSSFVGRCSVLDELEFKYGLTYGFFPDKVKEFFSKLDELLSSNTLEIEWKKKRRKLVNDKVDLNQWIINFFEKEKQKL